MFKKFLMLTLAVLFSLGQMWATENPLYTCDFTGLEAFGYTQDKTFTLATKEWKASVAQLNGGVFYLGCNSNNAAKGVLANNSNFSDIYTAVAAADEKVSATTQEYALLFNNAYNNVGSVEFAWAGGNNAFQVYLFGYKGTSWELLASTNYATSGAAVAGNVKWTSETGVNFSKFAVVARPGTPTTTATNKTLRAKSFTIDAPDPVVVPAPTFDVAAGTYTEYKTVKVSNYDATLSYYYTLDGSNPTNASTAYTHAEGVSITSSCTLKMIAYKGSDKSSVASAAYVINKPIVFASLTDLVAANLTSGQMVTVSFEKVAIKDIYVYNSERRGVYFDIQKGSKDIEIYYSTQQVPSEWVVGGTLSGTMTCPWTVYAGTWELAPASGSWDWSNLTYNAPVVKTLSSIAVSGDVTTKDYMSGEALDPAGLVVTGTYTDLTTETITEGVEWTLNPTTLTAGATTCEVVATVGEISSEPYTVSGLNVKALDHIEVSGTPTKVNYYVGDEFETAGLVVTAVYTDQSTETITEGIEWNVTPSELTEGLTSVSVTATVGANTSDAYTVNGLTVVKPDFTEVTYNFASFTSSSSVEFTNLDGFVITLAANGGTNPAWNVGASEARVYAKGSLTVKANNAVIKSIKYKYTVNANNKGVTPTIDGVEGKTNAGTWVVGDSIWTGADDEVTFSTSGSAGNVGFTSLTIRYTTGSKIETSLAWSATEAEVTINGNDNVFPTLTTTPADLAGVTYESSNTAVATIAADGTITLVKVGETTITAKYEGDAEHAEATPVSYTLTVVKAPFVPTAVESGVETVNFTAIEPYKSLTTGGTADMETYEGTSFSVEFAKKAGTNNAPKFYQNGNAVRVYVDNTLTITGAENITYVDINWTVEDKNVSITGLGTKTVVVTFSGSYRFTAITVYYDGKLAAVGAAAWEDKADNDIYTTNTAVGKHGTICLPYKCAVEGAVVYEYQGAEYDADHNVTGLVFDYIAGTTKEYSNYVEAGKAYVYFATEGTQYWTRENTVANDVVVPEEGLKLVGTYSQIELAEGQYFLFSDDDMFHPAGLAVGETEHTFVNVPAFRAYITGMPNAGAPIRLIMPKTGVATGVENAADYKATKALVNGKIVILRGAKSYNVAGQVL